MYEYFLKVISIFDKQKHLYLLIALVTVFMGLVQLHQFSYSSDDVAEQTIVKAIEQRGISDTWLPPDPWILKYPIYIIAEMVTPTSRAQILLTSIVMNLFLVFCVFYAVNYFLRKIKTKSVTLSHKWIWFAWIFSLNFGFLGFLRMPNTRNFELGLLLLGLVFLCKIYYGELKISGYKRAILYAILVLFLSLNFYSDPYYFVFMSSFIGVLFALDLLKKTINMHKAMLIGSFILISLVMYFIITHVLASFGFHVNPTPKDPVSVSEIPDRLILTAKGIYYIFSAEGFFSGLSPVRSMAHALNVLLGVFGVISAVFVMVKSKSNLEITIAAQPLIIIAAYVLLSGPNDVATSRYLVLMVLYLAIVIPLSLSYWRSRMLKKIVFCTVIAMVVFNSASSIFGAVNTAFGKNHLSAISGEAAAQGGIRNSKERLVIAELQKRNLHKGYGNYWESLITTYLSDYSIQMGQVLCDKNGQVRPYYWVVQDKVYNPSSERSFFIFNSKNINHTACNLEPFGDYKESITIDMNTIIFVYDYDLSSRFPNKSTLSKPD